MNKIATFLIFVIFLLYSGCKEEEEDTVEMSFAETQCANPWNLLVESENYLTEVRNYLETQGVVVLAIGRELIDQGPFCEECNCPTGHIIVIRIPEENAESAADIGFVYFNTN